MCPLFQQTVHSHTQTILLAAMRTNCENYVRMIEAAGFSCITFDSVCAHSFSYSSLTTLHFDLLLLPGGGDLEEALYHSGSLCEETRDTRTLRPPDWPLDLMQFLCLHQAILRQLPVLGICKGMQLLNVYFGGDLYPHLAGSEKHCYQGGDQLHSISTVPSSQFIQFAELHALLAPVSMVNSAHHQGVHHLGNGLYAIQRASDGVIEGILHDSLPLLGLQWHPERLSCLAPQFMPSLLHLLMAFSKRYDTL